jgi:hypothetical protein
MTSCHSRAECHHVSATHAHDEAQGSLHHASATNAYDEIPRPSHRPAQRHPRNPYRPPTSRRPAIQPPIISEHDWRPVSLSQVTPFELSQLFTASGFRIWENLAGAVQLCESSGMTRAELPRPRAAHGENSFAANLEDTWRRTSLRTVSRTELVELLVASRICVHGNSAGDLRLTEWDGRVLVALRNPNRPSRPSYAA